MSLKLVLSKLKEDISTGTGRGQTIKDVDDFTAVKRALTIPRVYTSLVASAQFSSELNEEETKLTRDTVD